MEADNNLVRVDLQVLKGTGWGRLCLEQVSDSPQSPMGQWCNAHISVAVFFFSRLLVVFVSFP